MRRRDTSNADENASRFESYTRGKRSGTRPWRVGHFMTGHPYWSYGGYRHRVLDIHLWIWWVSQDKRLGKHFIDALDGLPADQRPWLSDISLWETATLLEKGRIRFNMPFEEWLEAVAHPRTVRIAPISVAIAAEVAALPKSFHRDPADRLIVQPVAS